ncbi:MAG: Rid family hydrolase [Burkholderiaceae bacterium]
MSIKFLDPDGLAKAGYSHVAVVTGGKTIFISGQVAADAQGKVVGDSFEAQLRQVFANIQLALAGADAGLGDVVKLTTYVVGLNPARVTAFRQIRGEVFGDLRPASTLVDTGALADPAFLVEVEVIAAI